jgi:hypothetical protein
MPDKMNCTKHGESEPVFVCSHLLDDGVALGFNRDEPDTENPFPDAWCDDCELIRSAHNGWNYESEKLAKISLICAKCYEQARIRNTRPVITLDDLKNLRWKCSSCDEWHYGPCLDFAYFSPFYWNQGLNEENRRSMLLPGWKRENSKTFLDEDYCAIDGKHFFVRGLIQLPIIGTEQNFCWGVWGSLSSANFTKLLAMDHDRKRTEIPPMFSWLSSTVPEYPETLSLKMTVRVREVGKRPIFELEPTDHPLSIEQHHGVLPERVKEIMMRRLSNA